MTTHTSRVVRGCLLLFLSGLCALVYQTVWMREFRAIFGASTAATSAVLGIFMGGLGLGALVLGKRIELHRRPLMTYGNLEIGVGLCAAVSPFLIDGARHAYLALGGSQALGVFALPVRLLFSLLILVVPATLMGGTLPAMARSITAANDVGRKGLALVYGLNTLGAVAGVSITSFFLFEAFGMRTTLWLTAGVNVLVGMIARSAGRGEDAPATTTTTTKPDPAVAAAAFVAGFAFLLYELVWYRLFSPILGGSTYGFSAILCVALLGIGAGGALFSFHRRPPSWAMFGITSVVEAILLLGPIALGDRVPFFVFYLREWAQVSFPLLIFSWFLILMVMVFPAALVSGYQFPLLVALRGVGRDGVAVDSGAIYSANTIGSIVGSVFGGFVLLPFLGAFSAGRAAALLLVVAGALALVRARNVVGACAGLAVVVVIAVVADGPGAVWRGTAVGAGRGGLDASTALGRERIARGFAGSTVETLDGVESGISVLDGEGYALVVNGKSDGNVISDAQTMVGATLLPALLLPKPPRTAFVIGLGTGQSAGWLATVPSIESVDVAEIEPAVLDFAARCAVTNKAVMQNDRVHHLVGDGRELLQVSKGGYDLIMSEPSNPYRAGLAGFYSTDFYTQAVEKLAPDGYFAQWIQGYEVEPATVQMAIATMKQHFNHVSVWALGYGDILLLASQREQVADIEAMAGRLATEPWREAFQRLYLFEDVDQVLALHIGNDALTTRLAEAWQGGFNSDDLPLLEFAFARSVGRLSSRRPATDLVAISRRLGSTHPTTTAAHDWTRVDGFRGQRGIAIGASEFGDIVIGAPLVGDYLAVRVNNLAGEVLRGEPTDQTEEALLALSSTLPTEAAALRLIQATRGGAPAPELLAQLVVLLRQDPWLLPVLREPLTPALARAAKGQGEKTASLLREPFAGGRLSEARRQALLAAWSHAAEAGCVADFDLDTMPPVAATIADAVACFAAFAPDRVDEAQKLLDRVLDSEARPFAWGER